MKNIFPQLQHHTFSASMDEGAEKIVLNGGKVLFDKKVTLLPVQLEQQKQEATPNNTTSYGGKVFRAG